MGHTFIVREWTSEAINQEIERCRAAGGGTVYLRAGEYWINQPVRVYSNINLIGDGDETILKKTKGVCTRTVADTDYNQRRIQVASTKGFQEGMDIIIYQTQEEDCWGTMPAKIIKIEENTIRIKEYAIRDYGENCTVSNAFPVIMARDAENVSISGLTIDGNGEENDYINGCRGGGIYFYKVRNSMISNAKIRNFNGDGISWQTTEHITVKDSKIEGCMGHGLHPGAGSQYSVVSGCKAINNKGAGLFVCWRVKYGTFKKNDFNENGYGISIGHRDTDNQFFNNIINKNRIAGIQFRKEKEKNKPDRCVFKDNHLNGNKETLVFDSRLVGMTFQNNLADGKIVKLQ